MREFSPLIRQALREDLGRAGDITTRFFVPAEASLKGRVIAKASGVICGAKIAAEVFRALDPRCRVRVATRDGAIAGPGQTVLEVAGSRAILSAERVALNFLQHLSGIATLTAAYAEKTRGTRARVYDTRKTIPGLRDLAKYAVRCGGGFNHRMGLYDAALIKDNHWVHSRNLARSVMRLRRRKPGLAVEIEAATLAQVRRALDAEADMILLDNMSRSMLRRAVALIRAASRETLIEISGGVTLGNIRALAKLEPDRISIGRLTHSAPALDMSLEIQ